MRYVKYIALGIVGNIIIATMVKVSNFAEPTGITILGVCAWTTFTLCLRYDEERRVK